MNGPYFVSAGKVINFDLPYYMNFSMGEMESYSFKLWENSHIMLVKDAQFTVSVENETNAMLIIKTDTMEKEESLYLHLKKGKHQYHFLIELPVQSLSLLIQSITNGNLAIAKISISDFSINTI